VNFLVPCPSCARHVRQSEASCPFCSAELSLGQVPAPVLPRGRLGRAATFAFGASLVGATSLIACGGDSEEGKEGGGGTAPTAGTMSSGGDGAPMPVYGAPAAGMGGASTGGDSSFAGSAIVPMYGAPPAGMNAGGNAGNGGSGGSAGNAGSGGSDANAGTGGLNVGPVYGTPPTPDQ
jgi:hypothetical protein